MPDRGRSTLVALWFASLTLALDPAPPARAAPVLAPHHAVYALTLAHSKSAGGFIRARGKLEVRWADVCSGWTVSQRTGVELIAPSGKTINFARTLNALETKDSARYRFFIRRLHADAPSESVRGEARMHGPDKGGQVTYLAPAPREMALPSGTLFPTAHTVALLIAAERNDLPLWRMVFDGSGEEGLFGVNAALLQPIAANSEMRSDWPLLRGQKSWRLRLAFFGTDDRVAEPEHEQTLRLFANGVVDELVLDYGNFALHADLELLEALPETVC